MQLLPQVKAAEARASDDEDLLAGAGGLHGHGHLGQASIDRWVRLRRERRRRDGRKGGRVCAQRTSVQQAGEAAVQGRISSGDGEKRQWIVFEHQARSF